jgi:uncharacterized phage infection (PIP) family protein YhgE
MPNLAKLDETIDQLEKQADMLKQNNKVLGKVAELATDIEKGVAELTAGNSNFEGTKKELLKSLETLGNEVLNIEKQNEKHIESLLTSNKTLLRDLESSTASRLERFSSDIQVTIRQERTQLQESLQSNLVTHFHNLAEKQAKHITFLRNLLFIVIAVCLGLGAAILLK